MKIWFRLFKGEKCVSHCTVEGDYWEDTLEEGCKQLDLACPMVMTNHHKDMANFSLCRFTPQDFIEPFPYTRLMLEILPEEKKKKQSLHDIVG